MKAIAKETVGFGMPWETEYGYAQAVKVGDTVYLSGQVGHDDKGKIVQPSSAAEKALPPGHAAMEVQMRRAYANAVQLLARYDLTLDHVVEEVLYVLDMPSAFAVAGRVRKAAYAANVPQVASTMLVTPQLALPGQLVEIKLVART